jgi:hypothetical protein
MKEAIWEATGGLNEVWGSKDPSVIADALGQSNLFDDRVLLATRVDYQRLRPLLLERFAGRRIEYVALLNESVIGHDFDGFIDNHIRDALDQLGDQGRVRRLRGGSSVPWSPRWKLRKGDVIGFPEA